MNGQMLSPASQGDHQNEVFSVWKRHITSLAQAGGAAKDMSASFDRRGARPGYVRCQEEFQWVSKASIGMPAMPQVVLNHYNNHPRVCFFDIMPEIGRAWATIDNTLYIWRIGDKDPTPVMNSHEAQYICCMGLAPVKAGVFMVSVKYVLVVCTNVEVTLLGVCFSDGTPNSELQLTPLAGYSVPCNTVVMCATAATSSGSIFLGGGDGNVYQLQYGKRQQCRLVCVSRSFLTMLGAGVLPGYLASRIWNLIPIETIVIDNDRHFLYTLSQNHSIRAYHLGPDGTMAPQEFACVPDVHAAGAAAPNAASALPREKSSSPPAIVHIAPIPPWTSSQFHFVVVTADGRRIFFEANPVRRTLRARAVMSNDGLAGAAAGLRGGGSVRSVRVALVSSNSLLVAESATPDNNLSELIATLPNPFSAAPQQPGAIDTHRSLAIEVVAPSGELIPGDIRVLRELPSPSPLRPLLRKGLADEPLLQLWLPAPRFAVMSSAGVLEVIRRRPIDLLQELLVSFNTSLVSQFFQEIGPAEASCMCFAIASCSAAVATPAALTAPMLPIAAKPAVADRAVSCLSDPQYIGTASWPSTEEQVYAPYQGNAGNHFGSVLSASEPIWSHMHVGLSLFVYRLLHKIWDSALLKVTGSDAKHGKGLAQSSGAVAVELALPQDTVAALEAMMRGLVAVVNHVLERLQVATDRVYRSAMDDGSGGASKQPRRSNPVLLEREKIAAIGSFAQTVAEALLLCRKLCDYNVGRLLQQPAATLAKTCEKFRLASLLTSQGATLATDVLVELLKKHAPSGRLPVSLSDELLHGCPTYFPYRQQSYLQAFQELEGINKPGLTQCASLCLAPGVTMSLMFSLYNAPTNGPNNSQFLYKQRKNEIADSFLSKVGSELASVVALRDVVPLLLPMGKDAALVNLSIAKANSQDSSGKHLEVGPIGATAATSRAAHFIPLADAAASLANSQEALSRFLKAAVGARDPVLIHLIFKTLISAGCGKALIAAYPDSSELEHHLLSLGAPRPYVIPSSEVGKHQEGEIDSEQLHHMNLLAQLHEARKDYYKAVEVLTAIGRATISPSVPSDSRPDRVKSLQQAMVFAGYARDEALQEKVKSEWTLARIQAEVLKEVSKKLDIETRRGAATDYLTNCAYQLNREALSPTVLFNNFCVQLKLWGSALKLMHHGQHTREQDIRGAWDLLLKETFESARSAEEGLQAACVAVSDLGSSLGGSSCFHLDTVALRLLQLAAGQWQPTFSTGPPTGGSVMVAECLSGTLGSERRRLLPVFQNILTTTSSLVPDEEHRLLAQSADAWEVVLVSCQKHFRAIVGAAQEYSGPLDDSVAYDIDTLTDHLRTFSSTVTKLAHLQNVLGPRFDQLCHDLSSFAFQRRRNYSMGFR